VDRILRNGIETEERDVVMEIHPLDSIVPPLGYPDGSRIVFDRKGTFERLTRIAAPGRLERTERGLRVAGGQFNVALTEKTSPLMAIFLAEFLPPETSVIDTAGAPGLGEDAVVEAEAGKGTEGDVGEVEGDAVVEGETDAKEGSPVFYLALEETFDWGSKKEPGKRQLYGEIGLARLDGVYWKGVYISNK
jgi:hypothetical protein